MKINRLGLVVVLVLAMLMAGCAAEQAEQPVFDAYVTGANISETEAGSQKHFDIPVEHAGDPVGIAFRGTLTSGSVMLRLTDADDQVVWESEIDAVGAFAINEVVEPPAAGEYHLGLAWDDAVNVQYSLYWKAGEISIPEVSPIALIGGTGMTLVALGYIIYAMRNGSAWGYLGLGALSWIVVVVLKFAWAIPVNTPLYRALMGALPESVALPIFEVYVGLLTGIFEVGLTWLLLRYTRIGRAAWRKVLAFGIGFGAVEALLIGLGSLTAVTISILTPSLIPLETMQALAMANNPLFALAPVAERLAIVMVHLFTNALLFYGVATHQKRWFWYAFAYKSAVDMVAAFAQIWGVETLAKIWTIEVMMLVFGAAGLIGMRWLRERYPTDAETITHDTQPTVLEPTLPDAGR